MNRPMRVSTTAIESYRLFMDPANEWMTENELLASIRGEFIPTPQVLLGQAWGMVLEDPDAYLVPGGYQCNGYSFGLEDVDRALGLIDRSGVFEAKAERVYDDCSVVAKVDHILGAHVSEFKTTTSSFNIDKYLDSCQWRFYLNVYEALKVTYHVFLLDDHDNGVVELKGIESFQLYPYPGLHADCRDLVREFSRYVRLRKLDALLRDRQRKSEAAA